MAPLPPPHPPTAPVNAPSSASRAPRPRHARRLLACGLVAVGAAALAGCLQRTVRPVNSYILTQADAEERARQREEAEDGPTDPIGRYEREIEDDPNNPRLRFELGQLYELSGELEKAELCYRAGAAEIEPGIYTGPHLFLGRVLVKQGHFSEAAPELERLVAIAPQTAQGYYVNDHYREAYYLLGVSRLRLGKRDTARKAFERYIRLGGDKRYVVSYFPDLIAGP